MAEAKSAKTKTKKAKKPSEAKTKTALKSVAKKAVLKKRSKVGTAQAAVKYYEAVGRRKRAIARVRLFTKGERAFLVNGKPYEEYFPIVQIQQIADGAIKKMKVLDKFSISALVTGGGISGQAEAVRHGTARALVKFNPDFRKRLKRAGFLRRDPRKKERRKFGLKKARRAPQWSKR